MRPSEKYKLLILYNNISYLPSITIPGWSDHIITNTLDINPFKYKYK